MYWNDDDCILFSMIKLYFSKYHMGLSVFILSQQLCDVSVVVAMDAELDESEVADVVQCEDRIVSQSQALLPVGAEGEIQRRVDELDEFLSPLGLETRLVVLRRANSIALYFICLTLSAVMSLRHQWRSHQLRDIVQKLFTFLSGRALTLQVKRLTWPLNNYQRCLDFFSSVQSK